MQPRTVVPCLLASLLLTACGAHVEPQGPDTSAPDTFPRAPPLPVVVTTPCATDAGPDVTPEAFTMTEDASPDVAPTVDGSPEAGAASCDLLPSTAYCHDDSGATSAFWCHGPPGTMAAPDDAGGCCEASTTTTVGGVVCEVPSGDYVGCDGLSHPYAIGYWANEVGPGAPPASDAGPLVQWSCWAGQTVPEPQQYVCPSGAACDVWSVGPDGGASHEIGVCR